jgi:hypothetical protein
LPVQPRRPGAISTLGIRFFASKLRLLNWLGYLPNVAVRVLEIGRSYAPGLIRRVLKEVDTPPGQIRMEGIDIAGEGG